MVALDSQVDGDFDVRQAYRDHGGELFGFVLNSLGERAAAEDCVQETFLRAWRSKERFDAGRGSVRSWLFAIARNVLVDALRARARRPVPLGDRYELNGSPQDTASERERARIVDRMVLFEAMASLSSRHREVIAAIQLDGMTYQELSDRTGVPVATLRTRAFYALRELRKLLGEEAGRREDRHE